MTRCGDKRCRWRAIRTLFECTNNRIAKDLVTTRRSIGHSALDKQAVGSVTHRFGSGKTALLIFIGAKRPTLAA